MSNYLIKDIKGPSSGKFPSAEGKTLLTNKEYLEVAKKVIKSFAPALKIPQYRLRQILSGEDYIAEVAMNLAIADLTYDASKARGKTPYSWRNYCGMRALQDCLDVPGNRKNRIHQSLDGNPDNESSPLTFQADKAEEAHAIVGVADRRERVRKYVHFLLKNSGLSPLQERVIRLKYMEGVKTYEEIGLRLTPPVSRQNVKQLINRALFKMKMTALGTRE